MILPGYLTRPRVRVIVILFALFVISLAVRAGFLTLGPGAAHPLEGDEGGYHAYAAMFVETGEWRTGGGDLADRPPATPFLLTLLYFITGPNIAAARWEMVVISSLVAPAAYLLGRQIARPDERPAILAGVGWAFYPPAVFYTGYILTENLAPLLTLVSLATFIWACTRGSAIAAAATGIAWALAALNRPVFLLAPIFLLGGQLVMSRLGPLTWRLGARQWVIAILALLFTLSPWVIRNYVALGAFIPTTTQSGHLLMMSNGVLENPDIQAGLYFKDPGLYELRSGSGGEVEQDAFGRRVAFEEVRKNWRLLPRPLMNRAKNFWTWRPDPYDSRWTRNDTLMTLVWVPTLLFFAFGPFVRSPRIYWPFLAWIACAFVTTLAFWGTPRFRFPVDPLIVLGAAAGFVGLLDRVFAIAVAGIPALQLLQTRDLTPPQATSVPGNDQ